MSRYRPVKPSLIRRSVKKAVDARVVTSRKGKLNWWDWIVASLDSAVAWTAAKVMAGIYFTIELLDSSADELRPAIKGLPKEGLPYWITIAGALVLGLLVLISRRKKGPEK